MAFISFSLLNNWQDAIIELSDLSGTILIKKEAERINEVLDLKGFSSGIYLLRVYYASGMVQVEKLVIVSE